MKELYKYKDRVLLYDTETKEVKELDKKTARKVLDSRAKVLDSRVRNSKVKDILEIYDDTLIIVTDEKNRVVYKGIVDYAPKEVRDGRWHKGANNKTFTINSERGVLTVKVLDSSVRDSIVKDSSFDEMIKYSEDLWKLDINSDEQTIRSLLMRGESIAKQAERSIEGLSREYNLKLQKAREEYNNENIEKQFYKARRAMSNVQNALQSIQYFFETEIKRILTRYSNSSGRVVSERFPGKTAKYLSVAQRLKLRFTEISRKLSSLTNDSITKDSVGVKDAMSESQALENFKRFLKKHYEYTDEDLKKARVELEKIDYPFKKSKEVWYGLPDGRVASYCSLDGKKWEVL